MCGVQCALGCVCEPSDPSPWCGRDVVSLRSVLLRVLRRARRAPPRRRETIRATRPSRRAVCPPPGLASCGPRRSGQCLWQPPLCATPAPRGGMVAARCPPVFFRPRVVKRRSISRPSLTRGYVSGWQRYLTPGRVGPSCRSAARGAWPAAGGVCVWCIGSFVARCVGPCRGPLGPRV